MLSQATPIGAASLVVDYREPVGACVETGRTDQVEHVNLAVGAREEPLDVTVAGEVWHGALDPCEPNQTQGPSTDKLSRVDCLGAASRGRARRQRHTERVECREAVRRSASEAAERPACAWTSASTCRALAESYGAPISA